MPRTKPAPRRGLQAQTPSRRGLERERSPSIEFIGMRRVAPAPFNNPDAGFSIRTNQTNTIFYVPIALLVSASTFFNHLRTSEEFVVPESDATMETILRFVCPVDDPVLQDMDDVSDVLTASLKYNIPYVTTKIRQILVSPRFMSEEPVRVYAIARRYGLNEEANIAARHSLRFPMNWPAYEEFEHISGKMYHELVALHQNTSRTLIRMLQDHPKTTEIFCHNRCTSPASWWSLICECGNLETVSGSSERRNFLITIPIDNGVGKTGILL
ncbi:hypothetical protein QCA50_011948 [Cerrena zonata]|uniref:BTB domain-containing protein n=1 Tax=Cerrena zonata TaxID=2478898 RepID=A0AAW0G072_9APHY